MRKTFTAHDLYEITKGIPDMPDDRRICKFWQTVVPLRYAVIVLQEPFETAYDQVISRTGHG